MRGKSQPKLERWWSLGTTIENNGERCVCAFNAAGDIFYRATTVGRYEDYPPGTPLGRNGPRWWKESEPHGNWLGAARKYAIPWRVERDTGPDADAQWRSPAIFSCAMEWYPGSVSSSEATRHGLPRRPGCWGTQVSRMSDHERTKIVKLTFSLELESYKDKRKRKWRYRSADDPIYNDSWVIKFNGHESQALKPKALPEGSLLAVFLSYGSRFSRRWNPRTGEVEPFAMLKIGSVLHA